MTLAEYIKQDTTAMIAVDRYFQEIEVYNDLYLAYAHLISLGATVATKDEVRSIASIQKERAKELRLNAIDALPRLEDTINRIHNWTQDDLDLLRWHWLDGRLSIAYRPKDTNVDYLTVDLREVEVK